MKVGDRVRYSPQWLKNTGQQTGDICFAKGIIEGILILSKETSIAVIEWDTPGLPDKVNVKNLERCK